MIDDFGVLSYHTLVNSKSELVRLEMNNINQIILNEIYDDDFDEIVNIVNAVVLLAEPANPELIPPAREPVTRNQNYYEEVIPNYTELQFREHFRMSIETFEALLQKIEPLHVNKNALVPLRKKLLFTIWMLSKPESFLACGDRFGLAKSSAHYIFKEIVGYLVHLMDEFITWPSMERMLHTAHVFEERSQGIPGVVGAIDGCHIPIKQPVGNAFDYYNRKSHHSIILQGTCDERGVFTDISVGMPGRMHDARVFRLSPLFEMLSAEDGLLPPNLHLIGDTAYPLMPFLMKPYRDNGHLTPEQIRYNIKLSAIRSIIERAFGLLKGKFRRLKYLDVLDADMANEIIVACCILHNFILLQGNPEDDYDIEEEELREEQENNNAQFGGELVGLAENKRRRIVNLCNNQ